MDYVGAIIGVLGTILGGVLSITLSAISIFINAKRRRQNGRGKKKD